MFICPIKKKGTAMKKCEKCDGRKKDCLIRYRAFNLYAGASIEEESESRKTQEKNPVFIAGSM